MVLESGSSEMGVQLKGIEKITTAEGSMQLAPASSKLSLISNASSTAGFEVSRPQHGDSDGAGVVLQGQQGSDGASGEQGHMGGSVLIQGGHTLVGALLATQVGVMCTFSRDGYIGTVNLAGPI